jgi:hypothetical protein
MRHDLPISAKLNLSETITSYTVFLLVDTDVVSITLVVDVDVDVFLTTVRVPTSIFPSDARSPGTRKVNLTLSSCTSSSL